MCGAGGAGPAARGTGRPSPRVELAGGRVSPSGTKIGSYPKPFEPRASRIRVPRHSPRTTISAPPGSTRAAAQTKAAPRRRRARRPSWPRTRRSWRRRRPWPPDHRADNTPGMPLSAYHGQAGSSATAGNPVAATPSRALARAFGPRSRARSRRLGEPDTASRPMTSDGRSPPRRPGSGQLRPASWRCGWPAAAGHDLRLPLDEGSGSWPGLGQRQRLVLEPVSSGAPAKGQVQHLVQGGPANVAPSPCALHSTSVPASVANRRSPVDLGPGVPSYGRFQAGPGRRSRRRLTAGTARQRLGSANPARRPSSQVMRLQGHVRRR